MIDVEKISATLESRATPHLANSRGKELRSLKGARGVPDGEIAKVAAETWKEAKPTLSDEDELSNLFRQAWEDGIVAVGLLAAMLPDDPADVCDLALGWLAHTDDVGTADAIGWLVLGPGLLTGALTLQDVVAVGKKAEHFAPRRAVVMAAMAALPTTIEGPAAAPLRERLESRQVAFVEEPRSDIVTVLVTKFLRDESPQVRKAMRRVLRTWTASDPEAVATWGLGMPGGLPKMLKAEVERAAKRASRLAKEQEE